MSSSQIDKFEIARSFGKAANTYDSVAHFQRWVGQRLMDKLDNIEPELIVDLGCGTGYFATGLRSKFKAAHYIGCDLSEDMLRYARQHHPLCSSTWIAGDAENLSFHDGSVDLVFSSLAIQWCEDITGLFTEIKRVLAPGGVFAFSTLIEGSLFELKSAWQQVDPSQQHVNDFPLEGDYLSVIDQLGFKPISVESEAKELAYGQVKELTRELKLLGAHNMTQARPKHMTGKARIRAFIEAYESFRNDQKVLPATYQVLFGVIQK